MLARWQISRGGGVQPRWSKNAPKLFYVGGDGVLRSVGVSATGGTLSFETPEELFALGNSRFVGPGVRAQYDVSPDGDRFVVVVDMDDEPTRLYVVLNWFEELNRLAPIP